MISKEELEKLQVNYEIVRRGKAVYLRRKPRRDMDAISKRQLASRIQFAELKKMGIGKSFEEGVEILRKGMKPIGTEQKLRKIILTQKMLQDIRAKMLKKNIASLTLPSNYVVKVLE